MPRGQRNSAETSETNGEPIEAATTTRRPRKGGRRKAANGAGTVEMLVKITTTSANLERATGLVESLYELGDARIVGIKQL